MKAFIYILRCDDGTLYTGWTYNLSLRIKKHNNGTAARYTRGRRPVELVYYEVFPDKVMAQKREYAVKKLSRVDKNALIENFTVNNDFV